MAKPITLINEKELDLLVTAFNYGAPVNAIIRMNRLDISAPTLKKLIELYKDLRGAIVETYKYDTMYESMFPEWLNDTTGVVKQDASKWVYKGNFPLGKWVQK